MVRPKWLGALALALAIAAGFAALGQWQLGRAIASGHVVDPPVEKVLSLNEVATVNGPPTTAGIGQLVHVTGRFAPGDYGLVNGRLNGGSATGYWVTARFTPNAPDKAGHIQQLAVARGWTATKEQAETVIERLERASASAVSVEGRLLPSEAPNTPAAGTDPFITNSMSVAQLVNQWHGLGDSDIVSSYLVERGSTVPSGLTVIYSPAPIEQATIDWLNVFYAAEWALFAGFAIFLWYRVVRDAWEKRREDDETAYAEAFAAWEASVGNAHDEPDSEEKVH